MKDIIVTVFWIIIACFLLIGLICSIKNDLRKEEYIKQLEQSLNEQIQEKQVYINILERKENERN